MRTNLPGILADFLATAPDAMLLVDAEGSIVAANTRADQLFGAGDVGLSGHSVDDLVPADLAGVHRTHRHSFATDPDPRPMGSGRDLVARRVDGSEFPVDVSLGTVQAGDDRLVVAAVRDITERVDAQRALAASSFIVDSGHDAICVLDSDRRLTTWNRAAERLTGRRAADVLGTVAERPLGLVDPTLEAELVERALLGERLDHYRTEIVRVDGQRVPVSLALAAVRDERGRVIGMSGILRDITEEVTAQQTLKEVQDRLAETQRLAHVGLWVYDVRTGDVQWSGELHEIVGVSPLHFSGDIDGHLQTISEDDRERVSDALEAAISELKPFHAEYAIERPDGEWRWLTSRGDVVVHAAGNITVHGICQDLTDQQRLLDALREADKLKDQFLGVVSHELRTPLTSILGFSQLLRPHVDGEPSTWLDVVVRNAEEMHGMVERILDYSRLHSGAMKLVIAVHDARTLVGEAMTLVAAPLAGHVVETEIDDVVMAVDQNAMTRVLVNLLTNAAKFSPSGSTIDVRVTGGGDTATLRVSDEGCGIPSDQFETVFERFHQVESSRVSTRRGVGVGLSIVKEYVEAMRGTVRVEKSSDSGTTVVVELPVSL